MGFLIQFYLFSGHTLENAVFKLSFLRMLFLYFHLFNFMFFFLFLFNLFSFFTLLFVPFLFFLVFFLLALWWVTHFALRLWLKFNLWEHLKLQSSLNRRYLWKNGLNRKRTWNLLGPRGKRNIEELLRVFRLGFDNDDFNLIIGEEETRDALAFGHIENALFYCWDCKLFSRWWSQSISS